MKALWIFIILAMGIVGHFDSEEAHHPADISEPEKVQYLAAYTTIDEYLAVTLNVRGKK